jgi:methionyl aminopeptidase
MIIVKSREEIELMQRLNSIENIRNDCLWNKRRCYHLHLDKLAEEFIRDHGAEPSFYYMDFQTHFVWVQMHKSCTEF